LCSSKSHDISNKLNGMTTPKIYGGSLSYLGFF